MIESWEKTMRAKGLKLPEKMPIKEEKEDLPFAIFKWFIKICIAIPFISLVGHCTGILKP